MKVISILVTILLYNCVLSRHHHHYRYDYNHRRMHPLSDEFIDLINSRQDGWTAGRNFHRTTHLSYIKSLMGTIIDETWKFGIEDSEQPECDSSTLPDSFDARETWPYCESMNVIRDQGGCGSCWAVGVASVMTDRICTMTTQTENIYFSDEDILTCCPNCLVYSNDLCAGGNILNAWVFSHNTGVVSGGTYRTTGGCKSYEFEPCDHTKPNIGPKKCKTESKRRKCEIKCTSNSEIRYKEDKKRFSKGYRVLNPMCEIYDYGPIAATMTVYEDFLNYKGGVYERVFADSNKFIGNHTIKIMGWGVEDRTGKKYWVAANSWNARWGDKGFFKIARGTNECKIESYMTAAKL